MRMAKMMSGPRIKGSSTNSNARANPPRARGLGPLAGVFPRNTVLVHGLADTGPSFKQRSIHFPNRLAAQQTANLVWETIGVKRLAQETIETGGARFQDLLLAGLGGNGGHDSLFQATGGPHLSHGGLAVLLGAPDIHKDPGDLGESVS